jgi:beta-mannosidase
VIRLSFADEKKSCLSFLPVMGTYGYTVDPENNRIIGYTTGHSQDIAENFRMYFDNYGALECKAPCSMYSVLLEHGLIEDPFYGINELEATRLSEKNCAFEGEFEITEGMLKKEHLEITFLGLDTICRIILNGKEIASVKNMHR